MENIFDGINELAIGQQAALRRAAGKSINEADASALQAFFSAVPFMAQYDQEKAFTVACIICLWKPERRVSAKPFAVRLHSIRSQGLDARFRNLIDTSWADGEGYLISKLFRTAKMLQSSEAGYPEPESLFQDLKNWDHPDRFVQRRWMEQYLNGDKEKNDNTTEEEN